MCDENTLDFVNELQAYMVRVIELEAENERLRQPKPNPLVEALTSIADHNRHGWTMQTEEARAALDARGLEIREKSDDAAPISVR